MAHRPKPFLRKGKPLWNLPIPIVGGSQLKLLNAPSTMNGNLVFRKFGKKFDTCLAAEQVFEDGGLIVTDATDEPQSSDVDG
jgi:hypothetical protein